MIAKQISMRAAKKSNFGELVRYITNSQNKQERVECITVTNAEADYMLAVKAIMAVQQQNRRAESDKTYHLMLSFPRGENPVPEVLAKIESQVCDSIGFGEHQRISAVHRDTDHLHVHIAINKIHPRRLTIHNTYCDYKILGSICDHLEIKHDLIRVNHQALIRGAQSQALSMEHAGGVESLLGWIRRECLSEIRTADSWHEFHAVLQRNGLSIAEKGNGLIISDKAGREVKPSSIARDLSRQRLEGRFGAFANASAPPFRTEKAYQPKPMASHKNTSALYAHYQHSLEKLKAVRSRNVTEARSNKYRQIEAAKRDARMKRGAIKLLTEGRLNKKVLYQLTSKSLHDSIQAARLQYRTECKSIRAATQRPGWLDWLQKRALSGDSEALAALRARAGAPTLSGNLVTGKAAENPRPLHGLMPESITKRGTLIYRAGASGIRDDGHSIKVSQVITPQALALSMDIALRRFGPCIKVEGSAQFKALAVRYAAATQLPVTFENPSLEQQRQSLLSASQTQEKPHESLDRSRAASTLHPSAGRNLIIRRSRPGGIRRSHAAKPGFRPPPQAENRMRDMHELFMAHNAFGAELLLPGDAPRDLEHQQSEATHGLRRDVPDPGRRLASAAEEAARQYIAEREHKRAFISDIPRHTLCRAGESGSAAFAGWREISDHPLVLLKGQESEIIVLPVDEETLKQVKQLRIGESVAYESDGTVLTRGLRL